MIDTHETIVRTEVAKGYGPTRKGRKSAQREVDMWTTSGDGVRYLHNAPDSTIHNPAKPVYFESVTTEVAIVEGGYACCYVTLREFVDSAAEAAMAQTDETLLSLLALHGGHAVRDGEGNLRELTVDEVAFGKALRAEAVQRGLI